MVNSSKVDLVVKLKLKIKGTSKDKKTGALEILKNPKTYEKMLNSAKFNSKNVTVKVNRAVTSVELSIKDVKLVNNADLNDDLKSSITDGWGENGIPFGEPQWEYSKADYSSRRAVVNLKNISKITPQWETYYVEVDNMNLPPNVDPTKEYGYPKRWCKKMSVFNPERPQYYYKNLNLHYSVRDDRYKAYEIPKMFNKLKNDFEKTKSGAFILPKKLESQVEKHTQYLSCQVPSRYAGQVYLKNDLPKEVPLKFFRVEKHPKNSPSYFVGNKLVHKTEPNLIWWESGKIVSVQKQ